MHFDALAFLTANFGSPKNVLVLFSTYGIAPPKGAAVEKWFQRGSVPSAYLPILACIIELERGAPVHFSRFLRTEGKNA